MHRFPHTEETKKKCRDKRLARLKERIIVSFDGEVIKRYYVNGD